MWGSHCFSLFSTKLVLLPSVIAGCEGCWRISGQQGFRRCLENSAGLRSGSRTPATTENGSAAHCAHTWKNTHETSLSFHRLPLIKKKGLHCGFESCEVWMIEMETWREADPAVSVEINQLSEKILLQACLFSFSFCKITTKTFTSQQRCRARGYLSVNSTDLMCVCCY